METQKRTMNAKHNTRILAIILAFFLTTCVIPASAAGENVEWEPVTISDGLGDTVTISERPERIVSLAPANTEILFALGVDDAVVGVTEYCTYPKEATTKPIIGGYTTVNIERVITQKPDLIVAYYGNGIDTINHLKDLGFTVITLNAESVQDTFDGIELLGKATGKTAEANIIIEDMQTRILAVTEKLEGVTKRPTVAHCMWADPLWVSGGNTLQEEIISLAGGVNAFDDVDGWRAVNLERFLITNPDYILVDSGMGMGVGGYNVIRDSFYNDPRFAGLTAVENQNVYVINADIIDRGGPRIIDCIEEVAAILHPDLFEGKKQSSDMAQSPGFGIVLALSGLVCGLFYMGRR